MAEHLMNMLLPMFEVLVAILNIISIIILIVGVVHAVWSFLKCEFQSRPKSIVARHNTFIKNYLGSYILLSLELLIVADTVESIIKPTFQDIFKLAILVIIRTVLSYFLNMEIAAEKDEETERME